MRKPNYVVNKFFTEPILISKEITENDYQRLEINNCLLGNYNKLQEKALQYISPAPNTESFIGLKSHRCENVKNLSYKGFACVFLLFNAAGLKKGSIYPLLEVDDKLINTSKRIISFGVNGNGVQLPRYGEFLFSYNNVEKRQYISFLAYNDLPDSIFGVYLMI